MSAQPVRAAARIDPRQVPVCRVDHHLPAVPDSALSAQALRQRFAQARAWQPEIRSEPPYLDRARTPAAVLVAVVAHAQPTVLLTQRTEHLSTHAGQIAFAGGRVDVGDADARAAALREAYEEIGLPSAAVEVLGELPPYLSGSAYDITPVVGLLPPGLVWQANPQEVSEVFEVPLAWLMNPAHHRLHQLTWQGVAREWFSMPYDEAGPSRYIWGVTAGILRNFYRYLSA